MNGSEETQQGNKKIKKILTYSVPYKLVDTQKNSTNTTNNPSKSSNNSKPSKDEIIKKAFKFHSQGNISEAAKYYQYFIDQGFTDHRVFSNYGIILKAINNLKEAELYLKKALRIKPDFTNAHYNLANVLKDIGKLQEAIKSYKKAIAIKPDFPEAHLNLGNIFKDIGTLQEAIKSYKKAIAIKPDFPEAHLNLGIVLIENGEREQAINLWIKAIELNPQMDEVFIELAINLCNEEKYELALKYLSKNQSDTCQSLYLGCLLSLDREKDFHKKYKELSSKNICNAAIGGIVEHANIIYEKKYETHFCNESIKYILWDEIDKNSFSENHLRELISYTKRNKTNIRYQGLLHKGFQTSGNLFSIDLPFIRSIKKALEEKIEFYKNNFKDSGQSFINNWPKDYELRSWMISMKTGGFLEAHNHEYGWITGSFYLQVPKIQKKEEEGNIAFSYKGPRYPIKGKKFNLNIQKIKTRDICIFPSSLFHHTIPFENTEERICFVFDLVAKNLK